jgi:holo-[acyl-carrier protein] synthase
VVESPSPQTLRREVSVIVGIGMDLVHIARVEQLISSKGHRALDRLFTEGERRYAFARVAPARHLAARVAAKEAAFKALSGTSSAHAIGWREMEVVIGAYGRPELALHGLARARADRLGVVRTWLSMSHDGVTAAAFVVLER